MPDKLRFPYGEEHLTSLSLALSSDRFQRYLDESGGDEELALSLYTWNTAVASAFYGPLQTCEVTLRNAVNAQLAPTYGVEWFNNTTLMRGDEIRMAGNAQDALTRMGKAMTPGRVIAELGFGFWVGLFANAYDQTIWRTHLFRAFHPRLQRHDLFENLDKLRTLRNRVAHHEPIFHRDLMADYKRLIVILGSLSSPVMEWCEHHSRVYDVLGIDHPDTERF